MWIKPKPTVHKNTLWKTIEENAHFEMLRHITGQSTLTLFSDFVSTVKSLTSMSSSDESPSEPPLEVIIYPSFYYHYYHLFIFHISFFFSLILSFFFSFLLVFRTRIIYHPFAA